MGNNDFGFNIPGEEEDARENSSQEEGSYKRILGDKPITWFWLMQHYSKANAEAYKRQKNARKLAGKSEEGKKQSKTDTRKKSSDSSASSFLKEEQNQWEEEHDNEVRKAQDRMLSDIIPEEHFGETIVLNRDGSGTEIVPTKTEKKVSIVLECLGYKMNVPVTQFPCRIGRDPGKVQICIADNMAVGRVHAELSYFDGKLYITDFNSKNGVFVNEIRIDRGATMQVVDGTRLRLADEQFIIHLD